MQVNLLQFNTLWMDPKANLEIIRTAAAGIKEKDTLLVLPEMFNTGYNMHPEEIPVEWQDMTLAALAEISRDYSIGICGSIPFYKEGLWYNTFVLVDHENKQTLYDKIHLFSPAGEKAAYTEGKTTSFFTFRGWDILPLICYDLRFPYLSFTIKLPDIIIYTANWPAARISHWKALLKARAIENQCYVVGVNRTGSDQNGFSYTGSSMIVDYSGQIMTEMSEDSGMAGTLLEKAGMESYRKKLPFSEDRKF